MAVPSTIKSVKKQDFTLTPLKVHNPYTLNSSELFNTGSGYLLVYGHHSKRLPQPETTNFDSGDVNSADGSHTRSIWKQIDHQYYRDGFEPNTTPIRFDENKTFRFLNYSASLLACPYMDYGERIKPGSVKITNTTVKYQLNYPSGLLVNTVIKDDGYGNLYVEGINNQIDSFQRNTVIGYWGFNDLFRLTRFNVGKINEHKYRYKSSLIPSNDYKSEIKNVDVVDGVQLQTYYESDVADMPTGGSAIQFNSESYVLTPHHQYFNFDRESEFTISFALKYNGSVSGSVISKRGVVFKDEYGNLEYTKGQSGQTWNRFHTSSSYANESTPVYPFDFKLDSNQITFSRSDGSNTVNLTGSVTAGTGSNFAWNYITVTRYFESGQPKLALFINSELASSANDTTKNPINSHAIMFGADNLKYDNQLEGGILDEVRILNETRYLENGNLNADFFTEHQDNFFRYLSTSVVGNVFYERGDIVISPLNSTFNDVLKGDFTLEYEGTHTIYHYEVLCRIPKGAFNLSMNPTARKTPQSDELIDEFTSKINSGSLRPYASSIGLYTESGELVAVAKLGQPIQMREDVDLNISIKFDG